MYFLLALISSLARLIFLSRIFNVEHLLLLHTWHQTGITAGSEKLKLKGLFTLFQGVTFPIHNSTL